MTADRIALAYFAYLAAAAWLVPRTPVTRRASVSLIAVILALLAHAAAAHQPLGAAWHAWLPILWLVLGYWLPAGLWRGPMPSIEARLLATDRWLTRLHGHDRAEAHALFEAAYLLVHPIVPLAWLLLWLGGHGALVDRFWSAVLIAGYACYGTLPWIQTRPPRALTSPDNSPPLRRLNLLVLDLVSVRANTFPSGHAAVAMLVALCVVTVLPTAGALLLVIAALIAAATVLGRYHYTADTVLGLAIAVTVWALVWLRA